MVIHPVEAADRAAVHALDLTGLDGRPEADLVDALRVAFPDHLSVVAENGGARIDHILFAGVLPEAGVIARYLDRFDVPK